MPPALFIQDNLSPSVINDFQYYPRLLWMQYKPSLKLFTKNADHHAVTKTQQKP
jgi:CRISPR-associated exonuclease, Cas4 family